MRTTPFPMILFISVLTIIFGASSAQATLVHNTNGELVGEFAGHYDTDPSIWIVYNSTLDRLFMIHSVFGIIPELAQGCPYFSGAACTGQPHLSREWWRWITSCNGRYFRTLDAPDTLSNFPPQLDRFGGCNLSPSSDVDVWEAEEILAGDFPFELVRGPLELTPGALVTQNLLEIPTANRWGLVALALFLVWQGVRHLKRFAAQ